MIQRRQWPRSAVFASLAMLAAAGCATTEAKKMSAEDAIAARQQLMKEQGAAMRSIQDKVKAGQIQAIAVDAEKLVQTSNQIPDLFPPGSLNAQTSRAKPEIWQKWSEFEGLAKSLNAKATQLLVISRGGDTQATSAAVADLGKTTCGACHNAFRGPEIKK